MTADHESWTTTAGMSGPRPCGTIAAYSRHRRAGEDACDDCRRAWRDVARQRRASKPRKPRVYRDESPADLWGFTVPSAFRERVDAQTADSCWTWTGFLRKGYGRYSVRGSVQNAHRVAYEWLVGELDPRLVIDHLCRNRACVNPAHLEQVTSGENTLRGETVTAANAAKTVCHRGHPLDGAGTGTGGRPRRWCKTCANRTVQCPDCDKSMNRTAVYKHRAKHCPGGIADVA